MNKDEKEKRACPFMSALTMIVEEPPPELLRIGNIQMAPRLQLQAVPCAENKCKLWNDKLKDCNINVIATGGITLEQKN